MHTRSVLRVRALCLLTSSVSSLAPSSNRRLEAAPPPPPQERARAEGSQPSVSYRTYAVALAHSRLGGRLGGTQPRGRVIGRPCAAVPPPHERVPSASLAPASLRLARERALEWEGGGAAGGPIAHSARSHSAHRDTGCPLAQAAADSRVARAQAQLPACLPYLGGPARTHSPSLPLLFPSLPAPSPPGPCSLTGFLP